MATWAKGIDFKNSANTARIGGIGIYGTDTSSEKLYIGLGSEPWSNAGLQLTSSNINFKGNKIYHAGDKPTPADIGAAAASHTHNYLPISGGTLTGSLALKQGGSTLTCSGITTGNTQLIGTSTDTIYFGNPKTKVILESISNPNVSVNGTTYTMYHTGNKPTPSEIGAASSSHGHSNMITLKSNHVSDWTGASSMSGKTYMGGWHGNLTSGTTGYISLAANGSNSLDLIIDGELFVKENNKVYHAGNKPDGLVIKGTNTISSTSSDTTSSWGSHGNSVHWYTQTGLINGQPSQYGFLFNLGFGSEVHQLWMTQSSGNMAHRGGNGSGWNGSWRILLDSSNYGSYALPKSGGTLTGALISNSRFETSSYVTAPTLVGDKIQGRSAANRAYMGSGSCRFDTNGNYFRVFTSAVGANDCGLRVDPSGGLSIMVNSVGKHALNSDGSKYGGSIEIEGITYGMSPIDSPKFLIEDILFNVEVEESGTIINLNNIFAKSINGEYAVFVNNNKAEISDKQFDNFKVSGYTGKVDIRIVGKRIEYENEYFKIMGGFEHGTEQEVSN